MKKILIAIKQWWNYVVLKKEHTEFEQVYGNNYNKKGKIYYFRDDFKVNYIGKKEANRVRLSRTFVKKEEYLANQYNVK